MVRNSRCELAGAEKERAKHGPSSREWREQAKEVASSGIREAEAARRMERRSARRSKNQGRKPSPEPKSRQRARQEVRPKRGEQRPEARTTGNSLYRAGEDENEPSQGGVTGQAFRPEARKNSGAERSTTLLHERSSSRKARYRKARSRTRKPTKGGREARVARNARKLRKMARKRGESGPPRGCAERPATVTQKHRRREGET